ncbi:MAG: Fn3-like domain-containing protein, partial [Coprothermobacterota bacterium]|nr:Fn3-like domain-containing protein [Coprothermobacterota bacterium]
MNTAKVEIEPTNSLPYSTRLQGAGRIQVEKAITNPVWVTENTSGKAGIALGDLNNLTSKTFTLKAENASSSAITYNLSGTVQRYGQTRLPVNLAGSTITFLPASVVVPALGSVTFQVTVDVSGNAVYENIFVDGFVYLTPTAVGLPVLHVPYTLFWGDWQNISYNMNQIFNPVIDQPNDDPTQWFWWWYTWPHSLSNAYYGWDAGSLLGVDFYGNFDRSAIAFSPNGDGMMDDLLPIISLMRGTPDLNISLLDAGGAAAYTMVDHLRSVPKSDQGYPYWNGFDFGMNWDFAPDPYGIPDGDYTLRYKAEIPGTFTFGSGSYETQDLPVIVDT